MLEKYNEEGFRTFLAALVGGLLKIHKIGELSNNGYYYSVTCDIYDFGKGNIFEHINREIHKRELEDVYNTYKVIKRDRIIDGL